jgi:hypothetical protein
MDGVLCDFLGGLVDLFPREAHVAGIRKIGSILGGWPRGVYDASQVLGVSLEELWGRIADQGMEWWENLPLLPGAVELWDGLHAIPGAKVYLLSSPARDPGSYAGKRAWAQKHIARDYPGLILTNDKTPLAAKGRILIDDFDRNVGNFTSAGGVGILYPQPWNVSIFGHLPPEEKVRHVLEEVEEFVELHHLHQDSDHAA